jgi:phage tail-like protein
MYRSFSFALVLVGFGLCATTASVHAAEFQSSPQRFDPYKNFKFVVKIDGRAVAGAAQLNLSTGAAGMADYRNGGDPSASRKSPGRNKYEALTLERGVTHDTTFQNWANGASTGNGKAPGSSRYESITLERGVTQDPDFAAWANSARGSSSGAAGSRKDVVIEAYDETGRPSAVYHLSRCWISEYAAVPDLNAGANNIAIEHIKLQCEGVAPEPPGPG